VGDAICYLGDVGGCARLGLSLFEFAVFVFCEVFALLKSSLRFSGAFSCRFCVLISTFAVSFRILRVVMLLREILTNTTYPPYFFCEISMPVIVPVRAVVAEKISLFHVCRIVMWAISSVVSVMVVAIVNFIPMMSFWLGWIVMVLSFVFPKVLEIAYFQRIIYWHPNGIGPIRRYIGNYECCIKRYAYVSFL